MPIPMTSLLIVMCGLIIGSCSEKKNTAHKPGWLDRDRLQNAFKDIVLHGQREPLGMAGFSDILKEEQVGAIYVYLIKLSQDAYKEQQNSQ